MVVPLACTASPPVEQDSSTAPTVVPEPARVQAPDPGEVIDLTKVDADPFEAGVLRVVAPPKAIDADLQLPRGFFYAIDTDGGLWFQPSTYHADGTRTIAPVWHIDPLTNVGAPWGLTQYVGRADQADGSGYVGEIAVSKDAVVWFARHEGGELTFDSYDVFAADRHGGNVRKIGESTVDWDGKSFSAFGDGNYPLILGGRAYWVDGTNLGSAIGTESQVRQAMSLFSAPLDASEEFREEIIGAWYPQMDRCNVNGELAFTYLVSAVSTHDRDRPSELRRRIVDHDGETISDSLVWSNDDPHIEPGGAVACDDYFAVAYRDVTPPKDYHGGIGHVEVHGPWGMTSLRWQDEPSANAGRLTAVEQGLFFFQWNGLGSGTRYFFDVSTQQAYAVGQGASFGFGVAESGGERFVVTASETEGPDEELSRSIYEPLVIGFPS